MCEALKNVFSRQVWVLSIDKELTGVDKCYAFSWLFP
jgi:hypothetical protein